MILNIEEIEEVEKILKRFKSLEVANGRHDIEVFLHDKAIDFQKRALATTHLIFDEETNILVGFFSLANKPLTMSDSDFNELSKNQQKKLNQSGRRIGSEFQINSYLIRQLGKNFAPEALALAHPISGHQLLILAYDMVMAASKIICAKYVWIECEDIDYLNNFYQNFGFTKINDFKSEYDLNVMILKLKDTK